MLTAHLLGQEESELDKIVASNAGGMSMGDTDGLRAPVDTDASMLQ